MTNEQMRWAAVVYFSAYRTGGKFDIDTWFQVKELYRIDKKFRAYIARLRK